MNEAVAAIEASHRGEPIDADVARRLGDFVTNQMLEPLAPIDAERFASMQKHVGDVVVISAHDADRLGHDLAERHPHSKVVRRLGEAIDASLSAPNERGFRTVREVWLDADLATRIASMLDDTDYRRNR